jgi:hypothetical protein
VRRRSERLRNKPAGQEVIPDQRVAQIIAEKHLQADDAANLLAVVREQNLRKDKRPVAQSGLREGLRSRSKKTDAQLAQDLHAKLNKHKSVSQVAKKVGKKKKKKK